MAYSGSEIADTISRISKTVFLGLWLRKPHKADWKIREGN